MQYLGLTIAPRDGGLHAVDARIAETEGVSRETLLDVDWLSDGSAVGLYRLSGDREALVEALAGHDGVRRFEATGAEGETVYLYLHAEDGEPLSQLLAVADRHGLLIQRPVEFTDEGVAVTVAGEGDALRAAYGELPAGVTTEVRRTGEFVPGEAAVLSALTDRQREALEAALAAGYYEVPREGTAEDVAGRLDCTPSTASELLRRAEARLVTALLSR